MTPPGTSRTDAAATRHPLAPGAGADTIREHLLVEDRARFDTDLRRARDAEAAGHSNAVAESLEEWRCVAIVEQDRERFVRTARRVAESRTRQPIRPDESLDEIRARSGM